MIKLSVSKFPRHGSQKVRPNPKLRLTEPGVYRVVWYRLPVLSSHLKTWQTVTSPCYLGCCYTRGSSRMSLRVSQTCPHELASRDTHPYTPLSSQMLILPSLSNPHRHYASTAGLFIRRHLTHLHHFHEGTPISEVSLPSPNSNTTTAHP